MLLPNPTEPPRRTLLRRADQAAIACIALVALVTLAGYWWSQASIRHRLIDLEHAESRTATYQVDINAAEWPEFAQLPGVGETLAKRIVAYRTQHGRFQTLEQLRHVSGIGAKRLDSIRAYLKPLAQAVSTPLPDRRRAAIAE
jgi:competence protein ComEA